MRSRWGVAFAGSDPVAVVLEYAGLAPQPVFVMGENAGIAAILRELIRPRAAYLAARTEHLSAVASIYRVEPSPPMVRMWVDRTTFRPYPAEVARLLPVEVGDLNRLYPVSYTHLRAHETGRNLVCRLLLEKKKKTITPKRKQKKAKQTTERTT